MFGFQKVLRRPDREFPFYSISMIICIKLSAAKKRCAEYQISLEDHELT
jgi:hypothetical protein